MAINGIRRGDRMLRRGVIAAMGSFANAEPSNKWRILFDHSTDGAGEVVFASRHSMARP